jgi:solute carrier family 12 (potassium/chloride transporters), member 9
MGELSTSFFSTLMGLVGAAKCLQALARDGLYPGFTPFAQGTKKSDEPIVALILTFLLSQITLFADINQIASFVTMTFLMTFFGTNLACFLLKLSSAPNFRPSFRYFTWWTAAAGVVMSGVTMFLVDGASASGCVLVLIGLFAIVHYTSPPKTWGDVSQSLIYHQVRKYLLRLKEGHVKFWRPQILLLVNDPRRSMKLVNFCNSMKKGGLYILGHVIVAPDFDDRVDELRRQQQAWLKYIDFTRIKAFVQVSVAPTLEWGVRNAVLSAGLGGMRPNIVVLGFFNLHEYRQQNGYLLPLAKIKSMATDGDSGAIRGELPTDECQSEKAVTVTSYLNVLEDLLLSLQMNVAVARNFPDLQLPTEQDKHKKKYIDLWPIRTCPSPFFFFL